MERLSAYLSGGSRTDIFTMPDTLRLAVVQVQFADSLMGGQPGSRRSSLRDSTYFANELKHLAQYYHGASRGQFTVSWELLPELYTLSRGMGYYGRDDVEETRVVLMVQEAIDLADNDIDFSQFHSLVLIHAGAGQETDINDDSRPQLWSSFYDLRDIRFAFPDSLVDGLATGDLDGGQPFLVDNFMIFPANSSQDGGTVGNLGIWAFEVGSRLGMLPMFDSAPATEGGPLDSRGAGSYCLMSYGLFNALGFVPSFPCVFNRLLVGWIDPLEVETAGHFRLKDINSTALVDTVCLKIPVTEGEYFLVVNRVHDTNFDSLFTFTDFNDDFIPDVTDSLGGAEFDFYLTDVTNPFQDRPDPSHGGQIRRFVETGSGIYIWHIDETVIRQAVEFGFQPNDFVSRKGVDLEEADGVQDLDGVVDASFSFGSYWDSFRAGHNTLFNDNTKPSARAYSGARSGVTISGMTSPGTFMECDVSFSLPYEDIRVRWPALSAFQPPTPTPLGMFDLDTMVVVVLADTGGVYLFNPDGSEYRDWDGDPSTVEPYLAAPGAVWTGPPAIGSIDCDDNMEIIASAVDGRVFAWNPDGSEVFDGDGNPATTGVLYEGHPLAAPPVLYKYDDDPCSSYEVLIVEQYNDSLYVNFLLSDGTLVQSFDLPVRLQGQFAATPAVARYHHMSGVVLAYADTAGGANRFGLHYFNTPFYLFPPPPNPELQVVTEWYATIPRLWPFLSPGQQLSSPAVGDLDADDQDEVVVTLPDGRMVIYSAGAGMAGREPLSVIDLRGKNPSAPALGDVDQNGTLEIAVFDNDYYYLFNYNGATVTDWPKERYPYEDAEPPPINMENTRRSPLIGDINGDGQIEILWPESSGALRLTTPDAHDVPGWPRAAPSGLLATPSVYPLTGYSGELTLVTVGFVPGTAGLDAVNDVLGSTDITVLSIQELPGSNAGDTFFWPMHQSSTQRHGRTQAETAPAAATQVADQNTMMIYPNPVSGDEVRVRIILNKRAEVTVEVYNLEGELAISRQFDANLSDVINTPFDEAIDISQLKSGLYFVRLNVEGTRDALVKRLAIKR